MVSGIVTVFIVDDSLFYRTALQQALSADPQLRVVGSASNAGEAERKITELSPNVVIMDEQMPDMNGIAFLKKLLPVHPVPVVLISSMAIKLFEALQAGAVDFVKKPDVQGKEDRAAFFSELAAKVKIAASAHVRRVIPAEIKASSVPAPVSIPLPALKLITRYHVVAIGASTGGTEATLQILQKLPADIPGILVTQHMPAGFTQMYAERLNRLCKFTVKEAKNGDRLERGHALVAPGSLHMRLMKDAAGYYVTCLAGEKVSGHCPSVDVLFQSVAASAGKDAVGIILTGMGRDGAAGLLAMRKAGAYTIGQDKSSSVVYGMPMEAFLLGAVARQLPVSSIAAHLIQVLNG